MSMWIVFTITLISHIGLIIIFEKQRKRLYSLRDTVRRQRYVISQMESQLRLTSKKLFK